MPKLIRYVLPLLVIAVAVAIAMAMVRTRGELPRREAVVTLPLVEILAVRTGPVPVTVPSRGTAKALREIDLVSEVSGRVVWVAPELLEGATVPAGTPLLRIDPIDYEVAVSDAKAAVASAEFSLAEVKAILKRAAIDEAEARLEASRDRLRQAQRNLADTEIRVPFNAIIDRQYADLGQYVTTGMAVMKLLSVDTAEIRLPVLAADIPFVKYGEQADGSWPGVELTAPFGELEYAWQGRLVRLEDRVDEQTRVFHVVAEVDQPYDAERHQRPLSLGLFVEALIKGSEVAAAVSIPRSALHDDDFVYLVKEGKLSKQAVRVVRRDDGRVIITEGLRDGDELVLSRLNLMVDAMPVATSGG